MQTNSVVCSDVRENVCNGTSPLLEPAQTSTKHLDDALTELKFGWFQIKMLVLAGGGYFAVCSELLVFVFLSRPVKAEWGLDDMMFPWLPFCSGIGGIIGGFAFGIVSDRFGRQKPFIISTAFVAVFGTVSAFAPSFWLLVFFRSLVSVGTGGLESVDFVLLLGKYNQRYNYMCCHRNIVWDIWTMDKKIWPRSLYDSVQVVTIQPSICPLYGVSFRIWRVYYKNTNPQPFLYRH